MLFRQLFTTPIKVNMNAIRRIATSVSTKSASTTTAGNVDYSQLVLVDVNDKNGYATLTLNRPPVNSINLDLVMSLSKALDEVEKNNSRGMILTSIIPKIFAVGVDIRELYKPDKNRLKELWSVMQDCWVKLYGSSYPTAAAINGHCPASGCFLSLSCEYRAMVKKSKLGFTSSRSGLAVPTPVIYTMRNIISSRQTELALMAGTMFTSDDALSVGLIDEIAADKSDAIAKCEAYLDRYKDIPLAARGVTKHSLRRWELEEISNNREHYAEEFVKAAMTPEAQAKFEAFLVTTDKYN